MKAKRIISLYLFVCIVLIVIGATILISGCIEQKNELEKQVEEITGLENVELEFIETEEPEWLDYKVTHYIIKGTNLLVSVQHNKEEGIHFVGVCEIDNG